MSGVTGPAFDPLKNLPPAPTAANRARMAGPRLSYAPLPPGVTGDVIVIANSSSAVVLRWGDDQWCETATEARASAGDTQYAWAWVHRMPNPVAQNES